MQSAPPSPLLLPRPASPGSAAGSPGSPLGEGWVRRGGSGALCIAGATNPLCCRPGRLVASTMQIPPPPRPTAALLSLSSVSGNLWGRSQSVALNHPKSTEGETITKEIGRYPIPKKTDLPYDIVELMEEMEVKTGFLPNVFKVMSHRPAEFRAFFAYYNAIMNKETGNLSKADKELIIVATSIVNKCPYCVIAHSALHRIYSKKPTLADQVAVNWQLADLSDREAAILDFALAICRADNITEEHFQKLEARGFDREDAWDIASISAFFAMSNRLAHFIDLHPNPEFYIMGRIPRDKKTSSS